MARFDGKLGFSIPTETRSGHFDDVITEKTYYGDVPQIGIQAISQAKINDDVIADTTVEIVADSFASDNMFAIRYVEWAGIKWNVTSRTPRGARLLLRLGGVYNGPTPVLSD